ncbi:P-type DNA transfer protein VirB5 [Burkholderia cenocepacia]|uniref:P-type DNA transfer protein VirB5 n=1 Tax=Burkholderia cenocepacia TaxID=95486 RepID=UPI00222FBAA9|nr:P-type DNA transfer protein VirB5 [Burkholderia cenocepacia]MCW3609189.1 P-type DNA transfer protein VirB5 [Burkholderia cenocepacia]MCW5189914.1 P-type DNA transfer protein VirB5 [Burkholderia cenocepacia]
MKTIRKFICAAAVAALCSTQAAHAQGIPVLDASTLAQAIITVQQLKQQYITITSQYQSMIGNRGLGDILNNPSLRNYLPDEWQSVYDAVKNGQLNGISGAADSILRQEGLTAYTPGQTRLNNTLAANKAMVERAYQASIDRLNNIQQLMQQSNLTQDPAAKADLQNRWSAEISSINADKMRLDLAAKLQDAEKEFAQQAAHRDMQRRLHDEPIDQ